MRYLVVWHSRRNRLSRWRLADRRVFHTLDDAAQHLEECDELNYLTRWRKHRVIVITLD